MRRVKRTALHRFQGMIRKEEDSEEGGALGHKGMFPHTTCSMKCPPRSHPSMLKSHHLKGYPRRELDALEADMDLESNSVPSYLQPDKETHLYSELN
uniref:Uncharacterized protein n=1 Tax=Aegilops tauschii subsp. strangulata TaxID=200361 RepID=A0A452XIT6_AEGTS